MNKITSNKYWIFILVATISLPTAFIIMLNIAVLRSEFVLIDFLSNILVSIGFSILAALIDYQIVLRINRSKYLSLKIALRVLIEALCIILLSAILIIIGNVFFASGISFNNYFSSTGFYISFIATCMINTFFVTFIEFYFQIRKNEMLQKENLLMQYQQLKSQINPHFLFNSLNVLTSLIHKDSKLADHYIQKLSQIYRYVLTQDTKDLVYVIDEVEFINIYIGVLQIRYGATLRYEIEISKEHEESLIPPMSLQLLVENAVKHNAINSKNPFTIKIKSEGKFIVVSNNIIPRKRVADGTRIGLKNLNQKYHIISGQNILIERSESEFNVKLPLL